MDEVEITLRMPRALWEAAARLATRRGVPLEQMMRQTLSAELLRTKGALDVTPLAQVRGQLSDDFEKAASWAELQGRLMLKGYALRAGDEGVDLVRHPSGQRLCSASKLGQDVSALSRRFGSGFPGMRPQDPACAGLDRPKPDNRPDPVARWQTHSATRPVSDTGGAATRLVRHV